MIWTLLANRYVRIALAALGVLIILFGVVRCIRHDAAKDERTRQQLQIERDKAAQAERERQAEENRRNSENIARQAAEQRQKEIDDATRNIPDAMPTARQRARVCLELRRDAAAHGRPQPAC